MGGEHVRAHLCHLRPAHARRRIRSRPSCPLSPLRRRHARSKCRRRTIDGDRRTRTRGSGKDRDCLADERRRLRRGPAADARATGGVHRHRRAVFLCALVALSDRCRRHWTCRLVVHSRGAEGARPRPRNQRTTSSKSAGDAGFHDTNKRLPVQWHRLRHAFDAGGSEITYYGNATTDYCVVRQLAFSNLSLCRRPDRAPCSMSGVAGSDVVP